MQAPTAFLPRCNLPPPPCRTSVSALVAICVSAWRTRACHADTTFLCRRCAARRQRGDIEHQSLVSSGGDNEHFVCIARNYTPELRASLAAWRRAARAFAHATPGLPGPHLPMYVIFYLPRARVPTPSCASILPLLYCRCACRCSAC